MITRNRLVGLVLAASALLAACGSDDADDSSSTAAPTTAPATSDPAGDGETTGTGSPTSVVAPSDDAAFPVTIETKFGPVSVPEPPERVVSVGYSDQDIVLALGVQPVGIRDWYGEQPYAVWPWAQDALGDAQPVVLSAAQIDYEAVAALQPDLIVGVTSGMTETDFASLSAIAPTIAQTDDYPDFGLPWQEGTRLIGRALGKLPEAEAMIADVEAQFAAARQAHPEFEGATGVVGFVLQEGIVGGYSPHDIRAQQLELLGFVTPEEVASRAGDSFYSSFSVEEIGLLDADVLVWITSDPVILEELRDNPLRQQLRAAKEGREVFLDDAVVGGAASFSSVLSLPYYLDHIVPRLAAAIDGDPATATD